MRISTLHDHPIACVLGIQVMIADLGSENFLL